jgi:hypothetical protein
LLFVTTWIVRWEIFDQGYPEDRWEEHRESIEPPVVGDGTQIEVRGSHAELLLEVPGQGARRVAMYFPLANVPGRGREPWGEILRQALSDGAKDAGQPGLFLQVGWDIGGTLELHVALATDPGSVGTILLGALDLAVDRYYERMSKSERSEQERKGIEAGFRELVASARSNLSFFGDVNVVRDNWLNTGDWIVFIHFNEAATSGEEISHAVDIFRDAARTLLHVHLRDGCIAFQSCDITAEVERGFRDAVKRSEDQVRHVRAIRADQGQTYQAFSTSIREQFGEFPTD